MRTAFIDLIRDLYFIFLNISIPFMWTPCFAHRKAFSAFEKRVSNKKYEFCLRRGHRSSVKGFIDFCHTTKIISIAKSKVIPFCFYGMHGTSDKYKQIKGLVIKKWTEILYSLKRGEKESKGRCSKLIVFILFLTIYSNKSFCIKRKSLQKTVY